LAPPQALARPPAGRPGVLVITPTDGLVLAEEPVGFERLRRFAEVDIAVANARYMEPLLRDARRLREGRDARCDVVLLGSIATGKYLEPLLAAFGERLRFPADFVGRGDMSRGGLLLRCARAGAELEYISVTGAVRRGAAPPRPAPPRGAL